MRGLTVIGLKSLGLVAPVVLGIQVTSDFEWTQTSQQPQ